METLDSSNSGVTPLTEEQLAYFSESTKRAVDGALARYQKRAVAGFLVLLIGVGFNLYDTGHRAATGRDAVVTSGRVVSVSGCNRDFKSITALRGVLIDAQGQVQRAAKRRQIPPAQVKDANDFYARQLKNLKLPDCRQAKKILTDDPNKLPRIPTPLHAKPKGND